jgi:hypothetical protein
MVMWTEQDDFLTRYSIDINIVIIININIFIIIIINIVIMNIISIIIDFVVTIFVIIIIIIPIVKALCNDITRKYYKCGGRSVWLLCNNNITKRVLQYNQKGSPKMESSPTKQVINSIT